MSASARCHSSIDELFKAFRVYMLVENHGIDVWLGQRGYWPALRTDIELTPEERVEVAKRVRELLSERDDAA